MQDQDGRRSLLCVYYTGIISCPVPLLELYLNPVINGL